MEDKLTAERLHELLHYDPETGVFTWLVSTNRRVKVGSTAGNLGPKGYIKLGVDGRLYEGQRLAVLYMTGEWPTHEVDHENTVRSDNKWTNLRPATRVQNSQNRKKQANNKSGYKGVVAVKGKANRWKAQLRSKYLGCFDTAELAHADYVEASGEVHGQFARAS